MSIFKCKMCGGSLDISEGITVVECDYCGTRQTVPTSKDEDLQGLYNRANTLRIKSEFDKAEQLYEKILQADGAQAEAYWGLILCKYGIEYVEDPATFKRMPTCHRASFDSIIADEDYKSALKYADESQKSVYEAEAKEIDRIQKEIIELSSKEEPYDVFICYKETDESGKRTQDSVIANDIYYQLTNEGFKVFYAAITLEDKLGSAYEPCIFAALNSAKVMLSIGTKPEYFNAVWVKNEWSRYLKLMKSDRSRLLIPCYKDMDAYELPEEFSHLQAQDMGKIGFINDVVRGIKKVIQTDAPKATIVKETVISESNTNVAPLLKRAYMFLEDGDWANADEYCEKVLDIDPECGEAYLGKLMAELRVKKQEALKDQSEPFDDNINYQKTVRFANDKLKVELNGYVDKVKKDAIYNEAKSYMQGDLNATYEGAINLFKSISGWKDADSQIEICQQKIKEIEATEEAERIERERQAEIARIEAEKRKKRNKKIALITTPIVCVVIAFIIILNSIIIPNSKYNEAIALMNENKYIDAIKSFEELNGYKDSSDMIAVCCEEEYSKATALLTQKQHNEAIKVFMGINEYKDSLEMIRSISASVISAGNWYTVGLKSNGTVVAAGSNIWKERDVENWKDIVAISTGNIHTVGLKSDGTVVATGDNEYGQCEVVDWKDIVAISAGREHTVGLKSDGTVVATGSNNIGQCDVENWTDIIAISAGDEHTVGLKSDGTVVVNGYGQADAEGWKDIVAICTGNIHTVGLKTDGTVVATKQNNTALEYGQCNVDDWKDIVAVSAAGNCTLGLKADGTVVATGDNEYGQCNVKKWENIIVVSSGNYHTVGLKADGTVVATGDNEYGQCNVKKWEDIMLPKR